MPWGYAQFPDYGRILPSSPCPEEGRSEPVRRGGTNAIKSLLDRVAVALSKGEEP